MSNLPKVYIYCLGTTGGHYDDYLMVAVAEDGTELGRHVCSHPSFAMGDLHNQRPRHDAYAAKFGHWGDGEFYKVIQLRVGESPPGEVMEAIRRRNEEVAPDA